MKRALYIFILLIASNGIYGQVAFIEQDWYQARERAEETGKYIFLDAYTDWCGWCKVMDQKTFTDEEVAAYVNENFVPVRIEMEKEVVGKELAMKYLVSSFPSFLVFSPEGELVYRMSGYQQPEQFLENLEKALDEENHLEASISPDLDVNFPNFYQRTFGEDKDWANAETVEKYMSMQEDMYSEVNWAITRRFHNSETANRHLLNNFDEYKRRFNDYAVEQKLEDLLSLRLQAAAKEKDEEELNDILNQIDAHKEEHKELTKAYFKIYYYKKTEEPGKFVDAVEDYISVRGYQEPSYINSQAWYIYQNVEHEEAVDKSLKWMEKVVEEDPTYAYVDTYAALLYKDGQLEKAESEVKRAIEIGNEEGEEVGGSEVLLEKIKEEKELIRE